jgi:hypothetical protein
MLDDIKTGSGYQLEILQQIEYEQHYQIVFTKELLFIMEPIIHVNDLH